MEELKLSRKKIINPYLVLEALISIHDQKKTVKVYLSSRKILNDMEISIWHSSDQSQYRSNWAPTPPLTYQ